MHSAIAVAKCFLDLASRDQETLSIVRIHKLVYFAHGWFSGFGNEKPLIDEALEAWSWGPVFPSLYFRLAGHAGRDIPQVMLGSPVIQDAGIREFIGMILKGYRRFRTLELSAMAHQKDTPWYKTVTETVGKEDTSVDFLREALPAGVVIKQETIREYFGGMVDRVERTRGSGRSTRSECLPASRCL